MSVKTKCLHIRHIVLTANDCKYICLCRMLKEDTVTVLVTDGDSLYKTCTQAEGWNKIWSNFALASVDVTDDLFVANMPGNTECILRSVKGKEKTNEMFSLIVALAENQSKNIDRDQPQKSAVMTLSDPLPSNRTLSNKVTKVKGSSIISPSKKKRKTATGVIYE